MSNLMLNKLEEFLDSEKGNNFINKIISKNELKNNRLVKLENYIENNDFDVLMNRMLNDNDETWKNKCYSKGFEPYPTNILSLIIELITNKEETTLNISERSDFLCGEWEYKGYGLQLFCGQGCFYRLYKNIDNNWEFFLQV